MFRPLGQCSPESRRPPARDPCAITYVVDLPVLGEEEVEVPVEQLSKDFMSSVVRRLPTHLPQIFTDLKPHIREVEASLVDDAEALIQRTLDRTVRPEIEAQKAQLVEELRVEVNKALLVLSVIGATIVGGVGLAALYTYRRRSR